MDALQPPLFLISSEIETLTGFKAPARQIGWLALKGWRFEQSGSGRPIEIGRAHV